MNINWIVRFKNKAWLLSFVAVVVAFIYNILGMFDVVPSVSQDMTIQAITAIVNVLVALGVIIDPTTAGVSDSEKALTYDEPK